MSAPTDKRIALGRDEDDRLLPGVMPFPIAERFGFSPVATDVGASSSSSGSNARPPPMLVRRGGRLMTNPCYRLPPRSPPMLARRGGTQPSPSPSPSPDAEAVDAVGKSSSTATDASRANGIKLDSLCARNTRGQTSEGGRRY